MVDMESLSFGSIVVDGVTHEHDLVIDRGQIRKRKKSASKEYRPPMAIRLSRWGKTSRGTAADWWWGPGPRAPCR